MRRLQALAPMVIYGALFGLSLVAINPWGSGRGEIWTSPKVVVVAVITLLNLGFLLLFRLSLQSGLLGRLLKQSLQQSLQQSPLAPSPALRWAGLLWTLFLLSGLVTTFLSPSPQSSLRAHPEMGDGWLYWLLVGAFFLSNALVLQLNPRLFRVQLLGILAGSVLLAGGIFPQVFDWRLDYTATSGQVSARYPTLLVSTMRQDQMPGGFFTSRGHAGFVLAAASMLALVGLLRGWLKPQLAWPGYTLITLALWATSTRGVTLAFIAGFVYLVWRFWGRAPTRRTLLWAVVLTGLTFGLFEGANSLQTLRYRDFPSVQADPRTLSSARTHLWETALRAITERPMFGWGFNGFGLSWPFVADWDRYRYRLSEGVPVAEIVSVNNNSFRYIGTDGQEYGGGVLTNKAHNLVLDLTVSVGVVGLLLYAALFGYALFSTLRNPARSGLEVLAVVYLVYCLTWFESAQYSHLAWWALSAGIVYRIPRARARPDGAAPSRPGSSGSSS
ncbi:MAG: O-antigen ligase family protein [Deinococcota bacterium]|nr:O-antigen ligase family protein [Deinococcota bacterium]